MNSFGKINRYYKTHNLLIENFSYLAFLQIFLLAYPLITYPYLVDVLGKELYGVILSAQMLASYASLFIDFGSNFVCAKHVSINREDKNKLSEILSNVLAIRLVLFVVFFGYLCFDCILGADIQRIYVDFCVNIWFLYKRSFVPTVLLPRT